MKCQTQHPLSRICKAWREADWELPERESDSYPQHLSWAQDKFLNGYAIDWAMHEQIHFATALAPKENQSQCNLLSIAPTKNI
jgi:hypothetical protein